MRRIPFKWRDPATDKKHEIWLTRDIVTLLAEVIETEEQAEDFMAQYSRVCGNAEARLGYCATLIKDEDIREDVLDLFMIDANDDAILIFDFGPSENPWGSCLGRKVIDGKVWTNDGIKTLKKKAV